MNQTKVKVVVVDDQRLFLEGIIALLEKEPSIDLVATLANSTELFNFLQKFKVDVVVLDVELPLNSGMDGIAAARLLKNTASYESIKVISISVNKQSRVLRALFDEIGVDGFIDKNRTTAEELSYAIAKVSKGGRFISKELNYRLSRIIDFGLTKSEKKVAHLLGKGMSLVEVSKQLQLSGSTVEKHRTSIYAKMNCSSIGEFVRKYCEIAFLQEDWQDTDLPNFKRDVL